ncbi:DUF1801 domain-containing protein [Gemmobacter sp.]|uniref:DUF1801 domain-containing protein n=1 Tax=Gemmobacter sp. TaxID=1898957 RepID=UPI002AFDD90D|nr:DUF1801 domain-containing protein [Gemmobacter sp.]
MTPPKGGDSGPRLLAGGNPQIPKGYGEAPVQAWLAAVPGWKQGVCQRLDALITATVPGVQKAVKWNSPFYGVTQGLWFLSYHCMTRYVKVAFLRGIQLDPLPPGASKQAEVRYLDIHETPGMDEDRLAAWIAQAARLPGVKM